MSSKEKFKQTGHTQIVQKRSEANNKINNTKAYSVQKVVVQKSYKTSYNANEINNNNQKSINLNKTTEYKIQNKIPPIKNQSQNKSLYQSKEVKEYEYTSGTSNSNSINLKHHPNQINNLIHNHKFYTSTTSKTENVSKTIQSGSRTRSERSERVQSLSPTGKSKYIVETKKIELFSKPRYSSVSNSSKETNVSISKTQIKKFMTNMWLEEMYCSNVESLCCLVDSQNSQRNSVGMYEKELEQKAIIIKDYEEQILKLKTILNMKEQEMKKLVQNLKQNENIIRNKKIYELNIKKTKNVENFDKDAHELQIISTKQERKTNENLDKDAHSLEIISMKKGWNGTITPSPVNEIYIQTIVNSKNYEEMMKMKQIKEEEIKKKIKIEKISNLEIQEMGILSIISRKPEKNNMCQHLESIMILTKENVPPLKFQKIQEINVTSHEIKRENEVQELDGLEIIQLKKNIKLPLQEQRLNGLEIQREYDMLLVKPLWNSLKIQGSGLNLLAMPRDIELENQEIDEFEILGTKPEKIHVLMPTTKNNMQKINNFEIIGKVKIKADYKIKKERIKLEGIPKKEKINWNKLNAPIKTTKLLINRNCDKIKPKVEKKWNEFLRPIKSTKLFIKGNIKIKIEKPKKVSILEMIKNDELNYLYSVPMKKLDEFDFESFNLNFIASKKKLKKLLKMINERFNIKGIEKKKISLIKNRIDSINIFGLKKKNIMIPSSAQNINLLSEEIDVNPNWNQHNKVMKTRVLNIPQKIKATNEIIKKVVNIEIKSKKKLILKPMKANKLMIKGLVKPLLKKPSLKQIKENKLYIRSTKKIEKKPEIILKQVKANKLFIRSTKKIEKKPEIILKQVKANKLFINGLKKVIEKPVTKIINWNELIKVQKNPNINFIHIAKKIIFKKQNLNSFYLKGIEQIQRKSSEKIIITNNWENSLKAQRNAKFNIKGKIKPSKSIKLLIMKGDKFMIKKEPEDEIIFNDDYNYLSQNKKENGKGKAENERQEKIVVIKEKEITPIIQREIRAQVIRVKEDSSETSSQSEVDVLAGIKKKGMIVLSSDKDNEKLGYHKNVINSEVIFTKKSNLGVNLGGSKYKKEIMVKNGIFINKKEHGGVSGLEISGNKGKVYYEKMNGIIGTIKEGNYKIINGNQSILTNQKKLTSYQSTCNIRKSNKTLKIPNDSKKKKEKNQLIVRKKLKTENRNETLTSGNINNTQVISGDIDNEKNKKIIFKSNLTSERMKHSSSSYGIKRGGNLITKNKEEIYFYEHKDNGNLNNENQ